MSRKIIWIASYPKSGNTLIRAIIASLFFTIDGIFSFEILKKISEWPKYVGISSVKLEPHRITFYLYDLVTLFHSYWNLGKENKEFRFILKNNSLNNSRLLLLQALFIVIRNGMSILGVSTPKSM